MDLYIDIKMILFIKLFKIMGDIDWDVELKEFLKKIWFIQMTINFLIQGY